MGEPRPGRDLIGTVPAVDLERLRQAGWYDPDAPDAADKRAMLELYDSLGVTTDEVLDAIRATNTFSAGLEPLLRRGDLSARQAAAQLGEDVAQVVDTYRMLGISVDDPDAPVLKTAEVDLLRFLVRAGEAFEDDEIAEINRATSAALSMLSESLVAVFVGGAETRLEAASTVGWRERAELTQNTGEMALRFGHDIGLFFRHHLRQAIDRQRRSMSGASDRHLRVMSVGFVDLVGFTSMSAEMDVHDLLAFIRGFEARSYDVASRAGGRIVKIIGDEVMVAALDPEVCAEILLGLIEEFRSGGTAPRGGMASGEVIARLGDFFGPVVNLASRLVDHAVPGEVLADAAVAGALGAGLGGEPAGRRMLKGFSEPVAVVSLRRR